MNVDNVKATIAAYERLQAEAYRVMKTNPERFLGRDAWLHEMIGPYDLSLEALPRGVECGGSTWSNRTQSHESYSFVVPYEELKES